MESCSNQKSVSYFIFFKVATLSLMTSLHTLGILSTSFTWNAFPTDLKEFPDMLSTCRLLFLHSAVFATALEETLKVLETFPD